MYRTGVLHRSPHTDTAFRSFLPDKIDILLRLQAEESAKRSFRLRVSSGVKYAFASSLRRSPSNYDRGRGVQRVQPCQWGLPTRTRRALRRGGIPDRPSARGYSASWEPPFASAQGGTWRSGSESTPDLLPREKSERSSGAVEDRVSQRGNSGTAVYGRKHHQSYARIHGLKAVALRCSACNVVAFWQGHATSRSKVWACLL